MLAIADRFLSIDFIAMLRSVVPGLDSALPDPAFPLLRTVVVAGHNIPAGCLPLEALTRPGEQGVAPTATEAVQPEDTLLIQYTSGTTAYPKGAMLSHASMLRDAFEVGRRLDLRPGDRYFSGRPLFHAAGTTMSLLCSIEAGACYLTTPSFDTEQVLDIMERERCTHTSGNDTMFLMMMSHPSFPGRSFSLRAGWAAATPSVMRQIIERMGITGLCSAFGMSECAPNAAMASVDDDIETRVHGFAKPLPGVSIRIWSEELGRDLGSGEVGEILVKGWNVMKGYYKMPEHTASTIDSAGWLHTGDLGVCDDEGRLAFVGRLKDSFRVGGENVAPAEVEDVLHRHPAIRQAQVVGVPDSRMVEVAAAYIILQPGAVLTEPEVIAWCRERCANFKVPRYVRFIDSFEHIGMTASAKIQKRKLRDYVIRDLGLESVVLTGQSAKQ
jgi:fatty-acyl-CoA synthase